MYDVYLKPIGQGKIIIAIELDKLIVDSLVNFLFVTPTKSRSPRAIDFFYYDSLNVYRSVGSGITDFRHV